MDFDMKRIEEIMNLYSEDSEKIDFLLRQLEFYFHLSQSYKKTIIIKQKSLKSKT